jgi:hypothetical protein
VNAKVLREIDFAYLHTTSANEAFSPLEQFSLLDFATESRLTSHCKFKNPCLNSNRRSRALDKIELAEIGPELGHLATAIHPNLLGHTLAGNS